MKIRNGIFKPLIFVLAIAAAVMLAALYPGTLARADVAAVAPFTANITVLGGSFTKVYNGSPSYLNATYSRSLADGESVSYRWYKITGEEGTEELVEGVTAPMLPITNVADSGVYKVVIKIFNSEYQYEAETERTFTITPRPAVVTWDKATPLIYNGFPQVPAPQARGIGSTFLNLNIYGHATNAGSGYVASVTSDDGNYTLTGELSYNFSILPKEITADWTGSPTRYLYNGELQCPQAVVEDIFGEIIPSTVLGAASDVNSGGYPANVIINNPNYRLESNSASIRFYIDPLPVDVIWDSLEILYTGSSVSPTATATGVGGYKIALNYSGTGVESGDTAYPVLATTLNPNYLLQNAEVHFKILPRPVSAEWILPTEGFTYNTRDQLVNLSAQYTRPDSTFAPLVISIEGGAAFRNAGTYTITAVMPSSINNYILKEDGSHIIQVTINKAKPVITVEDRRPVFTYTGDSFQVTAEISADIQPAFIHNETRVSNSFREAGIYHLSIITDETANYLAANPVSVVLTINNIYFSTGGGSDYSASIVYQRGTTPDAALLIKSISEKELPRYSAKWDRKVLAAYELSFDILGEAAPLRGKSEVTFKVPQKYADMETLKIISYSNGTYREQIVKNNDGYVKIKLAQDGVFAITETNDKFIFIWWAAVAGILIATILAVTIHFAQKNKRIG